MMNNGNKNYKNENKSIDEILELDNRMDLDEDTDNNDSYPYHNPNISEQQETSSRSRNQISWLVAPIVTTVLQFCSTNTGQSIPNRHKSTPKTEVGTQEQENENQKQTTVIQQDINKNQNFDTTPPTGKRRRLSSDDNHTNFNFIDFQNENSSASTQVSSSNNSNNRFTNFIRNTINPKNSKPKNATEQEGEQLLNQVTYSVVNKLRQEIRKANEDLKNWKNNNRNELFTIQEMKATQNDRKFCTEEDYLFIPENMIINNFHHERSNISNKYNRLSKKNTTTIPDVIKNLIYAYTYGDNKILDYLNLAKVQDYLIYLKLRSMGYAHSNSFIESELREPKYEQFAVLENKRNENISNIINKDTIQYLVNKGDVYGVWLVLSHSDGKKLLLSEFPKYQSYIPYNPFLIATKLIIDKHQNELRDGLNTFSVCKNKNCSKYNIITIENLSFGSINLNQFREHVFHFGAEKYICEQCNGWLSIYYMLKKCKCHNILFTRGSEENDSLLDYSEKGTIYNYYPYTMLNPFIAGIEIRIKPLNK